MKADVHRKEHLDKNIRSFLIRAGTRNFEKGGGGF